MQVVPRAGVLCLVSGNFLQDSVFQLVLLEERSFQGWWVWAALKAGGRTLELWQGSSPGMDARSHLHNFAVLFYCIACTSLCDSLQQV